MSLITARVTHLVLKNRRNIPTPAPIGMKLAIMRATNIPIHFYRYIYEQVGRKYNWMLRRVQSDVELAMAIHSDKCEIQILYVDGAPAGFFELDLSTLPTSVGVTYFGLMADFQGRGLGRFFLHEAIDSAWSHDPEKITLQTNSMDNPRALQLYQKMGFVAESWSEETIETWSEDK